MEELKYGWCGKILWVDLKNRTSREQDISDLCKEYIGCRGIAAKLCWDYLKPVTGAFDEEILRSAWPLLCADGLGRRRHPDGRKAPGAGPAGVQ